MRNILPGGWSDYRMLTPDEFNIFNRALNGFTGTDYQPIAVATQQINGLNYSFFCNATPITTQPLHEAAMVDIYVDNEHHINLQHIHRVSH